MDAPDKTRPRFSMPRLWRRLPLIGGLLLVGILLAACQHPGEEDAWGSALQPNAGEIHGLTPEHLRSHPTAMTTNADDRRAYITMGGTIARPDNKLAVVDLENGTLRDTITVGVRPLDVQNDPQDRDILFVANPYSPSITVVDTESNTAIQLLDAPYYIERIRFTSDGAHLLAADRAGDQLIIYTVERNGRDYTIEAEQRIPTGPNPQEIEIIPTGPGMAWDDDRLVAVTDRHGASVTLIDLHTGDHRRIDVGGPPLALASRDGLLFVAGIGPGNGTGHPDSGSTETGTAALENSLLVLDLRQGPDATRSDQVPPTIRYQSDTARGDAIAPESRILGGALPHHLQWDEKPLPAMHGASGASTFLWVTYHSTDQVQALVYTPPNPTQELDDTVLQTTSGIHGERLSGLPTNEPLGPGRLTDTRHAIFETPPGPRDTLRLGDRLFTLAQLPEQLHVTDLSDCPGPGDSGAPCTTRTIDLVQEPIAYPTGPFERGERLFISAFPSADQDRSAVMCHVDGLSSGQNWGLPHRDLEPVQIPRLDEVADNAPWLLDGSVHRPEDYLDAAAGDMLRADPQDPHNLAQAALDREETPTNGEEGEQDATEDDPEPQETPAESQRFPGATTRLQMVDPEVDSPRDWMRLTFAYLMGERRVPPPPPYISTPDGRDMEQGLELFEASKASCASCHIGNAQTGMLLSASQSEDIPRPANAERIKVPPLGSLWDRETIGLLYDGRVHTIQAALLPSGHECLEPDQTGLDDPWHGNVADHICDPIDDMAAYLRALEEKR